MYGQFQSSEPKSMPKNKHYKNPKTLSTRLKPKGYSERQRERKEEENRIMEHWIPWTLINIKPFKAASGDAKVFLLRPFTFDPQKFHESYRRYKWEIIWIIPDGTYIYYHEPVFKKMLLKYTRNKGKRVLIGEENWKQLCESKPANERYDKIATRFENGTALSYDHTYHHGSPFSNNIYYDVKGRLSASRIKSFLPSSTKQMHELSVDDLTKRYKNLIKAYKHIGDDVPAQSYDNTIHAMARGNIYENCALFYLDRGEWCLQDEQLFQRVTNMHYQPDYKKTREDSYQPNPQKKRLERIMDRVVQDDLNHIKELGLYRMVTEQRQTISPYTEETESFDIDYQKKYTYKKMHETCFGKDIPVLPDAVCTFRGKKTVVEVKCTTKHYTPSEHRKYIPQMTLEMYAYQCTQCLFVEYVTDTYKEGGGTSSVRVRLLKYNEYIMKQMLVCFKALEIFSLSMQHHKKVTKDLPNDFDVTNPEHYDIWKDHEHFKALKKSLENLCMMFEILNEYCQKEAERYYKSELKNQDFSHLTKHLSANQKKIPRKNPFKPRKRRKSRVPNNDEASKRPKESHDSNNYLNDTFDKLSIRF